MMSHTTVNIFMLYLCIALRLNNIILCCVYIRVTGSGQSFTVVDSTTANAPRPIAAFNIHQKSHIKFMNQKEDEREESKN